MQRRSTMFELKPLYKNKDINLNQSIFDPFSLSKTHPYFSTSLSLNHPAFQYDEYFESDDSFRSLFKKNVSMTRCNQKIVTTSDTIIPNSNNNSNSYCNNNFNLAENWNCIQSMKNIFITDNIADNIDPVSVATTAEILLPSSSHSNIIFMNTDDRSSESSESSETSNSCSADIEITEIEEIKDHDNNNDEFAIGTSSSGSEYIASDSISSNDEFEQPCHYKDTFDVKFKNTPVGSSLRLESGKRKVKSKREEKANKIKNGIPEIESIYYEGEKSKKRFQAEYSVKESIKTIKQDQISNSNSGTKISYECNINPSFEITPAMRYASTFF